MFSPRRLILLLTLCGCLGLAACGGSSSPPKQTPTIAHASGGASTQAAATSSSALTPPSNASPQTIVAHVGSEAIHLSEVQHLMALAAGTREPVPDPPSYGKCVQAAKASEGAAPRSEEELHEGCAKRYQSLLQSAISRAIHTRWILGAGSELHLPVSSAEIQREFEQSKKSSFKTEAEFETYRQSSGQTVADFLSELRVSKLTDQIFALITRKEHPATSAEVAAYYASHAKQFSVPQGLDVRIFRTTSKAAAARAKQEIQKGKSFAEVAKQLSAIAQPIGAKEGEVKDLLPGLYEEKPLNDAIFTAKPRQIYGPLEIIAKHKTIAPETNSGFFVFEVLHSVPGKRTPLAKAKASIAEALTESQRQSTLAGYIAAFRKKWTARTDCAPGYVVRNCKQYTGPDVGGTDPYTL
jgi:foldase protein PrsA